MSVTQLQPPNSRTYITLHPPSTTLSTGHKENAPERVRAVSLPAGPVPPAAELPGSEERRHGAAVLSCERAGTGGPEQCDPEPRA